MLKQNLEFHSVGQKGDNGQPGLDGLDGIPGGPGIDGVPGEVSVCFNSQLLRPQVF